MTWFIRFAITIACIALIAGLYGWTQEHDRVMAKQRVVAKKLPEVPAYAQRWRELYEKGEYMTGFKGGEK